VPPNGWRSKFSFHSYNEKADAYSYSIILTRILTSDFPYRGLQEIQIAMSVNQHNNRSINQKTYP
jgi:hypothetical protein